MFRTYHAAEYALPLCDFGPPSPFPPYLLRFTQLLLTAQSCCRQLSPATGLPLQQQELQELCLTPHNCLALISEVCSAKYWVIPACPQEGFQCHFPWGPTRPLRIFVKEKKSCSHTSACSRALSIQSIYLKHPAVTLRLSCFSSLLRQLLHK